MSWIGRSSRRVKSSTDAPAAPAAAAAVIVAATPAGSSAKQSSRSAFTGSGVAAASAAVWAIASSAVTPPSRRPSVAANPELVVAMAANPSEANSFAEPASQAFGITSGSPGRCRARNVARVSSIVIPPSSRAPGWGPQGLRRGT